MSGNLHSAPIPVNTKSNPSPTTLPTLSGRYLRVDGSDRHVAADRSGLAEQLDGLGAARVSRIAASHRAQLSFSAWIVGGHADEENCFDELRTLTAQSADITANQRAVVAPQHQAI